MWNVCSFSLNFNISLSSQMGLIPYDAGYSVAVLEFIDRQRWECQCRSADAQDLHILFL